MKNFYSKITLIIALSLGLCIFAQAQRKTQDVLYLKNGSVIRGSLQEMSSTGKISIQTADKSLWVYEQDEILRMAKEDVAGFTMPEKGYFIIADLGLFAGRNDFYTRLNPSLHVVNGYQFNKRWMAGIGIGLDRFEYRGYAPLFGEGRFLVLNKQTSPVLSARAGWAIPTYNEFVNGERLYKGGLSLGGSIGITRYIGSKTGIQASVGYNYQETKFTNPWWWGEGKSTTYTRYHSLEVRFGFLFR